MSATFTEDEIINTIKRSGLPTVLVEGKTDAAFYRSLENAIGTTNGNFLSCGGRTVLMEVYKRKTEFVGKRVCFVADKDMWIFTGVPPEFSDIIFSEGYSIENDLYTDADIERLIEGGAQKRNHQDMISSVCRWFACEVEKCRSGQPFIAEPPNLFLLIPHRTYQCCPNELASLGFFEPERDTFEELVTSYKMKLRGKLLFKILTRFFTGKDAAVNFSEKALVSIAVNYSAAGSCTRRLLREICAKIGAPVVQDPELSLDRSNKTAA